MGKRSECRWLVLGRRPVGFVTASNRLAAEARAAKLFGEKVHDVVSVASAETTVADPWTPAQQALAMADAVRRARNATTGDGRL